MQKIFRKTCVTVPTDWSIRMSYLSTFKYTNKIDQGEFNAKGGNFQAELGANFFPGEHIGFNVHAGYNKLSYKNGDIEDRHGTKADYELYLTGANIGIGLMLKF